MFSSKSRLELHGSKGRISVINLVGDFSPIYLKLLVNWTAYKFNKYIK